MPTSPMMTEQASCQAAIFVYKSDSTVAVARQWIEEIVLAEGPIHAEVHADKAIFLKALRA